MVSRTKKFIVIFLFSFLISGCFYNAPNNDGYFAYWTNQQVSEYFDSINSLQNLSEDLIMKKYTWQSDGQNITYLTDTFQKPNVTLARGWGNCNDYTTLFIDFVKYKHEKGFYLIDSYNLVLLRNGLQWHYIVIFKIGGFYLEQSNLSLTLTMDEQSIYDKWYDAKWHYQSIIERWVK